MKMSPTLIIVVSIIGVIVLAAIAYMVTQSVGVKNSKGSNWGNRHVKSSANGGKPENAVGFASEGNVAVLKSSSSKFAEALDQQLKAMGISEEDWQMVQTKLRDRWHLMGSKDFKKAIDELNEDLFFKKGCVAVYAEYGPKGGQKAMTVFTQTVWDALPE